MTKNTKASRRSSSSNTETQIFRGIGRLYSLEGAHAKKARSPKDEDLSILREAAMVARDGRIEWMGSESALPKSLLKRKSIREENLGGACVLPAFVESHTHLIFAGNRAGEFERRNRGESYQSIAKSGGGILSTVNATRNASLKELTKVAQQRAERFLKQGVTTIEVKSGYALTAEGELKMLRAARDLKKVRTIGTFLGAHAIPKDAASAEAYLAFLASEVLPQVRDEQLAKRVDIFIENGYFDAKMARTYLRRAKEMGFDLAVHAEQLSHSGGAEVAVELGARSAEHLIQINKDDVKRLSRSEVTSVLLPSSDLYMNCAYPPARALLDAGARVALATDYNPGSSPSQDLALVGVLARIYMKMSLPEVLVAYTLGGAHALGLGDELGSLTPGKTCDFSVLDSEPEELFLDVGRMPIARVYREGKRLV